MNKNLILSGIVVAAIATSCSSVRTMPVADLSGEWSISKIENKEITVPVDIEQPYLAFDVVNNHMFGSIGCNTVMGAFYASEDGKIDLSGMGVTRMMCPDMTLEDQILSALSKVTDFGIDDDGNLILLDEYQHKMVTLTKRTDSISPATLQGSWKVDMLGNLDLNTDTEEDYTIEFTPDGIFSMTTGCNNVGGSYSGQYVDITFGQLRSTRMACPDMSVEQEAQTVLPSIVSFGQLADEGSYGFYDTDNNLVMIISRK